MADPRDQDDWDPATSAPGELFTPEGKIAQAGAFARGLRHGDPRRATYRRSMRRTALVFAGAAAAIFGLAFLLR